MQRIRADINPEILKWARQQRRSSLETVAKRVGVKAEILRDAENGVHKLTMTQLRNAASFFRRPLAGFFLEEIPKEFHFPDFRNLNLDENNYENLEPVIRSILTKKSDAINFCKMLNLHHDYHFVNSCKIDMPIESIALKIENELKIDKKRLKELKTEREAFNYWRDTIENLGILVFQFAKIDYKVTRGFSFSDTPFPIIAVNRATTPYARIFTLAHELAHIFLNESGICANSEMAIQESQIEVICNKVATKLLVPDKEINRLTSRNLDNKAEAEQLIKRLSKELKVSFIVIVIKLSELELIDEKLKGELYPPPPKPKPAKPKKSLGFVPPMSC